MKDFVSRMEKENRHDHLAKPIAPKKAPKPKAAPKAPKYTALNPCS